MYFLQLPKLDTLSLFLFLGIVESCVEKSYYIEKANKSEKGNGLENRGKGSEEHSKNCGYKFKGKKVKDELEVFLD